MKFKLDMKWVIRGLCVLLIIGFFIPCFSVSCANQTKYVSACTATGGYRAQGEWVAPPLVWTLLFLFIPAGIAAASFIKAIKERIFGIIVSAASVFQFTLLMIFAGVVSLWSRNNYCEFKVVFGFVYNILFLLPLMAAGAYVLILTFNTGLNTSVAPKVDAFFDKVNSKIGGAGQPTAPAHQAPVQPAPQAQPVQQAAPVQQAPVQQAPVPPVQQAPVQPVAPAPAPVVAPEPAPVPPVQQAAPVQPVQPVAPAPAPVVAPEPAPVPPVQQAAPVQPVQQAPVQPVAPAPAPAAAPEPAPVQPVQPAAPVQPVAPAPAPAVAPAPEPAPAPVQQAPIQPAAPALEHWFCPRCGNKNGADYNFCAKCGNPKPQM